MRLGLRRPGAGGVAVSRARLTRVTRSAGIAGVNPRRGPGTTGRNHLRADAGRLPVPGHRPRRVQPARRRLGAGGATAHRAVWSRLRRWRWTNGRPIAVIHHSESTLSAHLVRRRRSQAGTGVPLSMGSVGDLLRPWDGREPFRDAGVRAPRSNASVDARRNGGGAVRVHRGLAQYVAASFGTRLSTTAAVRRSSRRGLWTVPAPVAVLPSDVQVRWNARCTGLQRPRPVGAVGRVVERRSWNARCTGSNTQGKSLTMVYTMT